MSEHFTPELGQMAFSNGPWQSHPMPPFIERGLMDIAETIAEKRNDEGYLTGNWGEEPWESEVFSMRTYCWCDGDRPGHEEDCPPNFVHHATGFTASWYKHVGRGASVSADISRGMWRDIVTACLMDAAGQHDVELADLVSERNELAAAVDRVRKRHPRGDEEPGPLAPGLWCPTCGRERTDNGYGACPERAALTAPTPVSRRDADHPETSAVSDRDAGREENTE